MKRYAFAGASVRGFYMYAKNLNEHFKDCAALVGIYDPNIKRSKMYASELGIELPAFTDFDEMIDKTKPDIVIVTPVDRYHHEYTIRAMERGCDVLVEKPLTIDAEKYNAIAAAQARTGRDIKVGFNYRFSTFATRIKEIMLTGAVGDVLSVHFDWFLNTNHGADYFRRWHRYKENSGGLLVHKSTHHFDLVNWLIEEDPVAVNAFGSLRFYGPNREKHGERCLTCPYKTECEFYFDIEKDARVKAFYRDCEDVDGYYRDRCVFAEDITAEDTMSVNVQYSGGAMMSYSLTAHSPHEGYRLCINGTNGRIEALNLHGSTGYRAGELVQEVRVYNRLGEEVVYNMPSTPDQMKNHGGGDLRLLRMLIRGDLEDRLHQIAGMRAGLMSIITGIAANESIRTGRQIHVSELVDKIPHH